MNTFNFYPDLSNVKRDMIRMAILRACFVAYIANDGTLHTDATKNIVYILCGRFALA